MYLRKWRVIGFGENFIMLMIWFKKQFLLREFISFR